MLFRYEVTVSIFLETNIHIWAWQKECKYKLAKHFTKRNCTFLCHKLTCYYFHSFHEQIHINTLHHWEIHRTLNKERPLVPIQALPPKRHLRWLSERFTKCNKKIKNNGDFSGSSIHFFQVELEFEKYSTFLWKEENRSTRRKTLGAETRTNNKLNPHMMPRPGIEPGPHCTTAPSLLPTYTTINSF